MLARTLLRLLLPMLGALAGCAASTSTGGSWAFLDAERKPPFNALELDPAKDACARLTGESKMPGYWLGYSEAFMLCMRDHGWRRVSSPL